MTALLTVDGLSKRFRGLVAVDRVSFAVPQGAIFAVIGPNGAGKTTLFNMIAGAMAPNGGSITFAGEPVHGLPADAVCRRGIARTFQIVRPFPGLSVEDNVTIGALLHRRDVGEARARAQDAVAAARSVRQTRTASRRRSRCRIASGSKSPARSPPSRGSCCSTR